VSVRFVWFEEDREELGKKEKEKREGKG